MQKSEGRSSKARAEEMNQAEQTEIPKTIEGSPVSIDIDHIRRHFEGSGVLGATITGWETPEEMLADPEVRKFIKDSLEAIALERRKNKAYHFMRDFGRQIGVDGVVRIADLPPEVQREVRRVAREHHQVNIIDGQPNPATTLHMRVVRRKGNPWETIVKSMWASNIDPLEKGLDDPEWDEYAFYESVR